MTSKPASAGGDVSWGASLLIVGVLFLAFAGSIKNSVVVGNGDPGPRAVPITVSCLLIAGGAFTLATSLLQRKRNQRPAPLASVFDADGRRVIYFAACTCAYVVCVPFAFYVSTFAFASWTIWWFGARWWSALLAAGLLAAAVWALFVKLFLVPLPSLLEAFSRV